MRLWLKLMVLACCWHVGPSEGAASEWELIRTGFNETAFVAVAAHPTQPQRIVAASPRALYESTDHGATWHERFRPPLQATIGEVAVNAGSPPAMLLATDQGVYASFDGGTQWSLAFRGTGEGQRRCTHVAFHPLEPHRAVLGTSGGLFASQDYGAHWEPMGIPTAAQHVIHFTYDPTHPDRLYVVTTEGVVTGSIATGQWEQRLNVMHAEDTAVEEPDEERETGEDTGLLHHLSGVAVDPLSPSMVYLATTRGVQRSTDQGLSWQWLSGAGLASREIGRLLLLRRSPLAIYAATTQGVARYDPDAGRWNMTTSHLAVRGVNDLAASPEAIWAATDQGLYRYSLPPEPLGATEPPTPQDLLGNFTYEPTIAKVQEAAIRYAEVHPEKIRRWRRQAALQALLPSVDVGWDHDVSRDSRIDEGTFPNYQLISTRDRDAGLDLSVTWDLGNLIWNQDQTSIDVRSKLMVQLRDDIVDEVTRTYFERRRLQVTLLSAPPSDQQVLLDKELRLQELTALIDGLTGGYFSAQTMVPLSTNHTGGVDD